MMWGIHIHLDRIHDALGYCANVRQRNSKMKTLAKQMTPSEHAPSLTNDCQQQILGPRAMP